MFRKIQVSQFDYAPGKRVSVYLSHDEGRYVAHVDPLTVESHDGVTFTKYALFSGRRMSIQEGRYSAKTMQRLAYELSLPDHFVQVAAREVIAAAMESAISAQGVQS